MNAQLLHVVSESLPASRKIHCRGVLHADLRVPMREIELHPSAGEPPLTVYDTSGPYTDPAVTIDIDQGLPRLRAPWILARGDVESYPGRHVQPPRAPRARGSREWRCTPSPGSRSRRARRRAA